MSCRRSSSVAFACALAASGALAAVISVPPVGAAGRGVGISWHYGFTERGATEIDAAGGREVAKSAERTAAAGPTVVVTTSFSGYAVSGKDLTSVAGAWTVPTLESPVGDAAAVTGISIENVSGSQGIAVATDEEESGTTTSYRAGYEVGSGTPVYVTAPTTAGGSSADTVRPGDSLSATVANVGANQWKIALADTGSWTFTTTVSYSMTATLAGWGTHLTSVTSGGTPTAVALADYGKATFSHLTTATSGGAPAAPPATSAIPFYMFNETGAVLSVPSTLVATTSESFTDHFVPVPARIYGQTSDQTAVKELEQQFPAGHCPGTTGTRAVILATDKTYADALSSAYLASALGTGTLLTPPTSLSPTTLAALKDEGITTVDVVGGPLAVSDAVFDELQGTPAYSCGGAAQLGTDLTVTRIAGATAYDTALEIATTPKPTTVGRLNLSGAYDYTNSVGGIGVYNVTTGAASKTAPGSSAVPTAILATAHTYQDAMAASTLAYADHLPILLTTSSSLSPQASTAITRLGIEQVLVMGGPLAVANTVVGALEAEHVSVLRIAGKDYTDTAIELAVCELAPATGDLGLDWPPTGGAMVARGNGFTDGLAGAVVAADGPAGSTPEPLLLTENATTVGTYLLTFLLVAGTTGIAGKTLSHLTMLGGPLALSVTAVDEMAIALVL